MDQSQSDKPLETVARELNVTAARLSEWRDRTLLGAEAAMRGRGRDSRDGRRHCLRPAPPQGQARRGHHGRRAAGAEDRRAGGRSPFGPAEAEAMSGAVSPVAGRRCGMARVARVWRLSRATIYRHRAPADAIYRHRAPADAIYRHRAPADAPAATSPARRGPIGACSDAAELVLHIRRQILAA